MEQSMNPQVRVILIAVLVGVLGFAAGAGWQYTRASTLSAELDNAQRDLTFQRLEATLGAATIEAQRGSYELGRQLVSDFYTGLQGAVAEAPEDRRATFSELLLTRDAIITSLSRSEVQSGSQLAQLFLRYRIAMGEPVGPQIAAPPPLTTQ